VRGTCEKDRSDTVGRCNSWTRPIRRSAHRPHPFLEPLPSLRFGSFAVKHGDQYLAYMLVKLELRTRATIYAPYTRQQSLIPGVDFLYRRWLAKNGILPAAVADRVYADVVPADRRTGVGKNGCVETPQCAQHSRSNRAGPV
jgi:hypothetical protein